jgi:hypothetical protein
VRRTGRHAPRELVEVIVRARAAGAAALLASVVLWAAPAHAAAPTTTPDGSPSAAGTAVAGHLLDVASSKRAISPWISTDLSALEGAAQVVGAVSVAPAPRSVLVVAGRTAAGHIVVFTSPRGATSWTSGDVTVQGDAALATGSPSVVVDPAGVTRIFFRSMTGDLDEIENDSHATDPWISSDLTALTASTHGPTIAGNPTALSVPGYATAVYARAARGALVSFTLSDDALHPWYWINVTALSGAPPIVGVPAAVAAPDGFGLTAVYSVTATGTLVEFTDDDAGFHLWSARNVSAPLSLPPVDASPSILAGLPTVVTTVTSGGHLLAVSIPTVSLVGASFQDLSALARCKVAPAHPASIVAAKVGYVVAAETTAKHLVIFHVASPTARTATFDDATMQPLTEQFVGSNPVAMNLNGVTHVLLNSAGYIGMIPRIVLGAESQDQHHARIEDTPAGSDCNPFTASFGRGSTAGCAPGTASEEWCSDFAQWVWLNSGVDTSGITGASKTFVTWGRQRHQFLQGIKTMPAVGDAVVWGVLNPLWGAHVGIVVAVSGTKIDVVSGNSGNLPVASAVWRSGLFAPASQTAQGDPIIGYVSPVALPASERALVPSSWPRVSAWPMVQGTGTVVG